MADRVTEQARQILHALADLAPSSGQRATGLSVPTEWFRWISAEAVHLFLPGQRFIASPSLADTALRQLQAPPEVPLLSTSVDRAFGERLAAIDQIRPEQRSVRVGWLFVAGTMEGDDGRPRRVFHPLVSMPVRVARPPVVGPARLFPAGDAVISELVDDRVERYRFESDIQFGGGALDGIGGVAVPSALLARLVGLQQFARAVAAAAHLPAHQVVPAGDGPDKLMRNDGLVIVAGAGVYVAHSTESASRAGSLRAWAAGSLAPWTAFHSLYLDVEPPDLRTSPAPVTASRDETEVVSPFLLTPVQRDAVLRSRSEPISLLSGAPGTGKSHTVVAIACDALARGESVLVAAKADATVDALLDLLERAPGPDPVVFGSTARREALASRLAAGQLQPLSDAAVGRARDAHRLARANERAAWQLLADLLGAETLVDVHDGGRNGDRDQAPGLFDPSTDLTAVEALLDEAFAPTRGWFAARRRRKVLLRLRAMAGCLPETSPADLRDRVREARAARAAFRLTAEGGLEIGGRWDELWALGDQARGATARWLAADCRSDRRLNRSTLPMVAALATALRSGRAARRDQLARIDGKLTLALPLWVGSLPDIDDLLPPVAGFFDLVILDEASSIDQAIAVPALLRARRGVVVGDPQQLRHVSFLSDERLREVVGAHGIDQHPLLAARLDVRRNSVFDLAAGVSPLLTLDEHFRCDPHLVEFVADRLYGGSVKVATRAPSTTGKDCVKVVRVEGRRDRNGVVGAEVEWVVQELERLRRSGAGSVGVISPFRAQADALEEAVLRSFTVDDLEALDLRVGTVHAFQGNERDVVVASLGIGPDQNATTWRFVEDPHLFTVLATRARKHLTVLVSAEPPAGGLVADYLEQADTPPGPPAGAPPGDGWVGGIADDIRSAGRHVITTYPCGRHVLDVCVDDGGRDLAIECGVHPDGPDAHIQRHLSLLRAGWEVLDAYPSRWTEHRAELVIELLHRIDVSSRRTSRT